MKFIQRHPQLSGGRAFLYLLLEQQEVLTIYQDLSQKQLSKVACLVGRHSWLTPVGFSPPFFSGLSARLYGVAVCQQRSRSSLIPWLGTFPQHTPTLPLAISIRPSPSSLLCCGLACTISLLLVHIRSLIFFSHHPLYSVCLLHSFAVVRSTQCLARQLVKSWAAF